MAPLVCATQFPLEIKELITSHCSLQTALALGRAHTSFSDAAERVVYRDIVVTPSVYSSKNSTSGAKALPHLPRPGNAGGDVLSSLLSKPARCAFVNTITLELFGSVPLNSGDPDSSSLSAKVFLGLWPRLTNVVDLRVRFGLKASAQPFIEPFNKILRSRTGPMRLKTLFFSDFLSVSSIIKAQVQVENLGIYAKDRHDGHTAIILHELRRGFPELIIPARIFSLCRTSFLPTHCDLTIFRPTAPTISSLLEDNSTLEGLEALFDIDRGANITLATEKITAIAFYLDGHNDPSMQGSPLLADAGVLAQKVRKTFPNVNELRVWAASEGEYADAVPGWQLRIDLDLEVDSSAGVVGRRRM